MSEVEEEAALAALNGDDEVVTGLSASGTEAELLQSIKKDLEEEKLREMHEQTGGDALAAGGEVIEENKEEVDARSIYVGNVDYSCTPEEIQAHFKDCGTINRVTIPVDKYSQQPKGFAYVEFASSDSLSNAELLDGTSVHNRAIKVSRKRTNVPGMSSTNRGGSPRGFRTRQALAAAALAAMMYAPPAYRGRGAPRFRNRRAFHHPYASS